MLSVGIGRPGRRPAAQDPGIPALRAGREAPRALGRHRAPAGLGGRARLQLRARAGWTRGRGWNSRANLAFP